jgi:hypothetical protein
VAQLPVCSTRMFLLERIRSRDSFIRRIKPGFVDGMHVPGHFYVNEEIKSLLFDELRQFSRSSAGERPVKLRPGRTVYHVAIKWLLGCLHATGGGSQVGGFLPALKQIGNVAALPGIVSKSIGLPDVHAGMHTVRASERGRCIRALFYGPLLFLPWFFSPSKNYSVCVLGNNYTKRSKPTKMP